MKKSSRKWVYTFVFSAAVMALVVLLVSPAAVAANAMDIIKKIAGERMDKLVKIEDPTNSLDRFYASLAQTAAGNGITRIAHYGDSIVEMDRIAGQMRRRMQTAWGDAGHGFVLASRPQPWYRPMDLSFDPSSKWICMTLNDKSIRDKRVGYAGVYAVAYKSKADTEIGTARESNIGRGVSRFEILYPVEPNGGPVEVSVDGRKVGSVNTKGNPADAYTVIDVPDGEHKLELRAMNEGTRLYGVILERKNAGVVYDSLGINGTGVRYWLQADTAHWVKMIKHRNPHLIALGYGNNEARAGNSLDLASYRAELKSVVTFLRDSLPHTSILLVGPIDQATKKGTALDSLEVIAKIVAVQQEVAKELGVAFYNNYEAMGGRGSMAQWYMARPRLGAGDLMHPTEPGGAVLGDRFYTSLMNGFKDYLQRAGLTKPRPTPYPSQLQKIELTR